MSYLLQALAFLVDVIFGIYIFILMLRFLLQWTQAAQFTHPMTRFVYQATAPVLRPLHRFIPRWRQVDLAALCLLLVLQTLKGLLIHSLLNTPIGLLGLVILALAELISLLVYIFIFSILIEMLLSWVNHDPYNPLSSFVTRLNQPLLRLARRWVPNVGGLDLSPLLVIILLQLSLILVVAPLIGLSKGL